MKADALAKRREAEDALHQRQLNQFIQDFCEAPDGQGFDHIARGNDRIADHAQFNGLSEEWQQAERQAFAGAAIEACVRSRLERGDPVVAKSMLDWGGKVMTPKAAAELRPMVDLQLSERQAERDADEVIGAVPSDDGSFDLASGLARIEAQDWPEPRKAKAARELRFRSGEARRQREAGHDEAGRAFGALLDERRAAGTPITSLKQIPVALRAKLRPELLQEFDAALQAQDAAERPQANSQLLGALTHLAATDPDEFRRRLVHPDLLRGRVTEAEAAELWRTRTAMEQGTDDGAPNQDILKLVEEEVGPASTPEEQATHGQIVFRVGQRIRREFEGKSPTDQLHALVASELSRADRTAVAENETSPQSTSGTEDTIYAGAPGALGLAGMQPLPVSLSALTEPEIVEAPPFPKSSGEFLRLSSHKPKERSTGRKDNPATAKKIRGTKEASLAAADVSRALPKRTFDVNRPIFVGGGGEGYDVVGRRLSNRVEPYVSKRAGGGNFFTHWDDQEVRSAIKKIHEASKPVILIGHSWGGADVIAAALWAKENGIPVDLLVTIDPVGVPNRFKWNRDTKDIAREWISVIADKPGNQDGDSLAWVWGKTPMSDQKHARVVPDKNAGHADFGSMLKTGGVEEAIARIYRTHRR